jgi:hypothetical protein
MRAELHLAHFLAGSIRSQFSGSQKTVEKTVKQLETGGNAQTSAKDNEQGVRATAASQGHRAGGEGNMSTPKKERGAGLSPAPPASGTTLPSALRTWLYPLSRLPKNPDRQFL